MTLCRQFAAVVGGWVAARDVYGGWLRQYKRLWYVGRYIEEVGTAVVTAEGRVFDCNTRAWT